jgi:hypothetical protein
MSVGIKELVFVETTGVIVALNWAKYPRSRGEMDSRDEATAIFDCYTARH